MFYLHCSIRLSRLILSPFCMNTFYQSCYVIPHPFENVIFFFLQNMFEDGHKISLDSKHESLETQSGSGVLTRTTYTCLTDLFKWKHKFSNEILRFKVFFSANSMPWFMSIVHTVLIYLKCQLHLFFRIKTAQKRTLPLEVKEL